MQIISNFHEDYDSFAYILGVDKTIAWVRKTVGMHIDHRHKVFNIIPVNLDFHNKFVKCNYTNIRFKYDNDETGTCEPFIKHLAIGARVFAVGGFRITTKEPRNGYYTQADIVKEYYVSTMDEIIPLMDSLGYCGLGESVIRSIEKRLHEKWGYRYSRNNDFDTGKNQFEAHTALLDLQKMHETPCILFDDLPDVFTREHLILNPFLSKMGLSNIMEHSQMFQELSMRLGEIHNPEKKLVQIADKDKIQQHGFNDLSFKNPIKFSQLK